MTRADNATVALGRSRDTFTGAAPLPAQAPTIPTPNLTRRRVTLRLWGLTRADLAAAERDACNHPGARLWTVTETVPTTGGFCPILKGDRLALAQGADYGCAWAVYADWGVAE